MNGVTTNTQRLLVPALWLHENRDIARTYCFRTVSRFTEWLRGYEIELEERGAVTRVGRAWRIVDPDGRPVIADMLRRQRERISGRQAQQEPPCQP